MNDNDDNKKQEIIDDIVSMLDNFMSDGGGHMNIDVNALTDIEKQKQVEQTISSDCNSKSMACSVPTLDAGIDREEN